MKIAYQYRLRPTPDQKSLMDNWIELLRRQYKEAIRIKYSAVGHPVLKAEEAPNRIPGVTENPVLYA